MAANESVSGAQRPLCQVGHYGRQNRIQSTGLTHTHIQSDTAPARWKIKATNLGDAAAAVDAAIFAGKANGSL